MLDIRKGHERTLKIKKNVLGSLVLKGVSILISLLLVPMVLNYLDEERYGLWLTLSSIIGWFSLFDVGLGNGLRNKFAEARALEKDQLAKTYVSTTFAIISIIIVVVLIIFLTINPFLNWTNILNTTTESPQILSTLALIVFVFFCLQFVFKLITSILLADQRPASVDLINVLGSLLSLIIIYVLLNVTNGSLILLGLALSSSPVVVLIIANILVFTGKYRIYKPSIKHVDFKESKSLMGLGFKFFIPQIASLIVFSSSNIIIAQIFNPSEVTVYNIAYKYFSLATMFFQILLAPFWSAFTEAYMKGEMEWIKNAIRKLILLWGMSCIVVVGMVVVANFAYAIWVGEQIDVPMALSICIAIYVCVANWNNIYVSFNAGVSKFFIQV
ncbi:MAG: MATE family efflux transporter, partial [Prevotellaceae bacterium]|nr:MATE family efflux transporter [Prevotellaceae bacterium]